MPNNQYKIGIDIGGTNTDIVLVDTSGAIHAKAKTMTTSDTSSGVRNALINLIRDHKINVRELVGIFLGTTKMTNAVLERENLNRVGVIRIAGQKPELLPSCYLWPESLKESLYVDTITIDGGFECHGSPITSINTSQIKSAVKALINKKIESLAVIGVFSTINPQQEILVKDIADTMTKCTLPVTLSHQIGGTGYFIERENSTILNAALKGAMKNVFTHFKRTCADLNIDCPLWVTQNNGSVLSITQAIDYPIFTISSGPTNSFIGGNQLVQVTDSIIIDIGGTSTDLGVIRNGIPRRCLNNSTIGGISINFSIPDVCSIALGGGSHVKVNGSTIAIGPQSSGNKIFSESLSFGGRQLTLLDVSLALGCANIPGAQYQNIGLSKKGCEAVMNCAVQKIYELISKIGPERKNLPVVMVGGGASLIPKTLLDDRFLLSPHADVANAYGAAMAEISFTVDTVVSLENRESTIDSLKEQATQGAILNGADGSTIKIVDVDIIPYNYVPNKIARVIIVASGKQKHSLRL